MPRERNLDDFEEEDASPEVDVDKRGVIVRGKGGDGIERVLTGKRGGQFDTLDAGDEAGTPASSVDGWVIIISGLPQETTEDDVHDLLYGYGTVKIVRVAMDSKEYRCIGHSLVAMESYEDCSKAIAALNGQEYGGSTLCVSFAFVNPPQEEAVKTEEGGEEEGEDRKRER